MVIDKNTLRDLSIFADEGTTDVFSLIDRTLTQAGREVLKNYFVHPPENMAALQDLQQVVKFWYNYSEKFPVCITNGTMVMLEQFFESSDHTTAPPGGFTLFIGALFNKLFLKRDYTMTQFSVSHLRDFFSGCKQLLEITGMEGVPVLLATELKTIEMYSNKPIVSEILASNNKSGYPLLSKLRYRARRELKNSVYQCMQSFSKLDAWLSMATATKQHGWVFPVLAPGNECCFCADGLYHPLVKEPVAYNIQFNNEQNFMLVTGANMSGKTTFLRTAGVAALLGHLGMGVPAENMRTGFLHNIITHMQVKDDILKGESYFYAEVQRMKQTSERIIAPQTCMVLMDELFKGTNVHDACDCTHAVIEGLLKHPRHIMILSTHLYEVARQFSENKSITFAHFITDTSVSGDYQFTYQMKPGISDDRIGFTILKHEGVIDLLNTIQHV